MRGRVVSFGRPRRRRLGIFFISVALIISLCLWTVQSRIRPVLSAMAESRAKNIATEAVNDSVWFVLSENDIKYDSLVELTTEENGSVTSIKVDSVKINTLCAEIRARITDYFNNLSENQVSIPIGSLTGIDMLAGKGPSIHIAITLSGSSTTKILNDFETAGINQTRHQMILDIKTRVYVIMQSGNISTEVTNSIIVAETVIVGAVPEIYSDGSNDLWQNLVGFE